MQYSADFSFCIFVGFGIPCVLTCFRTIHARRLSVHTHTLCASLFFISFPTPICLLKRENPVCPPVLVSDEADKASSTLTEHCRGAHLSRPPTCFWRREGAFRVRPRHGAPCASSQLFFRRDEPDSAARRCGTCFRGSDLASSTAAQRDFYAVRRTDLKEVQAP